MDEVDDFYSFDGGSFEGLADDCGRDLIVEAEEEVGVLDDGIVGVKHLAEFGDEEFCGFGFEEGGGDDAQWHDGMEGSGLLLIIRHVDKLLENFF